MQFPCCMVLCVLAMDHLVPCLLLLVILMKTLNCLYVCIFHVATRDLQILKNNRPVLTRLKSHCGPGVRNVKELPLRNDLKKEERVTITTELQCILSRKKQQ